MMPTLNKLTTSDDRKGRKATDIFRAMYNNAELEDWANGSAQHLNENPEFPKKLLDLIQECSKKFVSKLFQRTKTFTISKNPESFTIDEDSVKEFLKKIIKREMNLKNPTPFIDNDLWRYFNGKTVSGILKNFTTTIYRFLSNLTHQQILEEAETTGIKKVHSYLEGLSIICKVILSGEVDTKGTGIIVYFKVDGIDTLYRFYAYRVDGGRLDVRVYKVYLVYEWAAGHGACYSNWNYVS